MSPLMIVGIVLFWAGVIAFKKPLPLITNRKRAGLAILAAFVLVGAGSQSGPKDEKLMRGCKSAFTTKLLAAPAGFEPGAVAVDEKVGTYEVNLVVLTKESTPYAETGRILRHSAWCRGSLDGKKGQAFMEGWDGPQEWDASRGY